MKYNDNDSITEYELRALIRETSAIETFSQNRDGVTEKIYTTALGNAFGSREDIDGNLTFHVCTIY